MSQTPPPLPLKNGVAASQVWLPAETWPSLLAFLMARFPQVTEAVWRSRLAKGEVVDATGNRYGAHSDYPARQRLFYYRELDDEVRIPFVEQILHMDEHLLVVDKPHFLPVTPSGRFLHETLLTRLRERLDNPHITPLHRLDRETAGVLLFSVNPQSRGLYPPLFAERRVHKIYEAIAPTRLDLGFPLTHVSRMVAHPDKFFRMCETAGEPNSETRISLLETFGTHSRYRLEPITGRKHQLRVHMASCGMPILNDLFYPDAQAVGADDFSRPLQLLAKSIELTDPLTHEPRFFASAQTLTDTQSTADGA